MSRLQRPSLTPATKKKNKGVYRNEANLSMVLKTPASTRALGRRLVRLNLPHVWLLRGNLGAGKTTLVRAVLRNLGVRGPVTSPTFGLVHRYRVRHRAWAWAVHIDAYRITGQHELAALEITELIHNPKILLLVEWPERLGRVRWGERLAIHLTHRAGARRATVVLRRR